MKRILLFAGFFFLCVFGYTQNLDLIVSTKGDSIACNIDSISEAFIYFEMKLNNSWTQTSLNKKDLAEYKYDALDKKLIVFKQNTSYIDKIYTEQEAYTVKLLTRKKTGKVLTFIGAGTCLTGTVIGVTGDDLGTLGAFIFMNLAGVTFMAAGIPIWAINSKKLKEINNNSAFNSVRFELMPSMHNNVITGKYQPGLSLCITF